MPRFAFSYTQAMNYAELRDAAGRLVGLAVPGETVREFDRAPDHMWTEAGAGPEDGSEAAAEPAEVPVPGAEQDAPDETPDAPPATETTPGA